MPLLSFGSQYAGNRHGDSPSNGLLTEGGDFLITEGGDYLVQES
jgi:hypothetical protein